MTTGTYDEHQIGIGASLTSATAIFIHGSGSVLMSNNGDGQAILGVGLPTTIRDLELIYNSGRAISCSSTTLIERVRIQSEVGIEVRGPVTARDVVIVSTGIVENGVGIGIDVRSGSLNLDRATLSGGLSGIKADLNTTVEVSNTLVHSTGRAGIDLGTSNTVNGSVRFVTITNTGSDDATTTFAGLICPTASFPVRSTIVWTAGANDPPTNSCSFTSTIVGPMGVVGATNSDPKFVNEAASDYHIAVNSPARDLVDTGPEFDFEGDPRPRGQRFDIGADEAD